MNMLVPPRYRRRRTAPRGRRFASSLSPCRSRQVHARRTLLHETGRLPEGKLDMLKRHARAGMPFECRSS